MHYSYQCRSHQFMGLVTIAMRAANRVAIKSPKIVHIHMETVAFWWPPVETN
jgi:hypothetical protein